MKSFFEINLDFIFYQKVVDFFQVIDLKLMVMIINSRKCSDHDCFIFDQEIVLYNINFLEFDHR